LRTYTARAYALYIGRSQESSRAVERKKVLHQDRSQVRRVGGEAYDTWEHYVL
jgi:hypothetical protein